MKSNYEKPTADIIDFKVQDMIMNDDENIGIGGGPSIGGEDVEDW